MPPTPPTAVASTQQRLLLLHLIQLLQLLRFIAANASPVDYLDYSCMSEEFLAHWSFLDEVYYRPMNFTDHCYTIPSKVNIGMTPCSTSMCVTVIEPKFLAGQHIGNNIIRGCFSSVFKHGYGPRAQSSPVLDTSCTRMPANRLLPPHLAGRSSNRSIELCWCVGQLCNDYPSVPVNHERRRSSSSALLLLLITTFTSLLVNRC